MIDAMIDKGKGLALGNLRIIELIEGDLQLIVQMHTGLKMIVVQIETKDYCTLISDQERASLLKVLC